MNGLKTSLNRLREISSDIYHQYVPVITDTTDIATFGQPILNVPVVQNEFIERLVNKIVFTSVSNKIYNNPLRVLEGDRIPLGYAGENIYTNPARGRQFNVDDFAGLLMKYEADVKVEYNTVNSDLQYCVTVSRAKLQKAFTSWENLESFIDSMVNSLYNGAYIDDYRFTKELIAGAYKGNNVQVEVLSGDPASTEALAKAFVKQARTDYLNFQTPSTKYNAWHKIGGAGRPVTTWTEASDIVLIIRNDIRASLDVDVLASSFNMDRADLMGRIITVDNFDMYTDEGELLFDGSNVVGMIADASWFKIKEQDMFLDQFYNANNRTWQYYLNVVKMRQFSYFANAKVYCLQAPQVAITGLSFGADSVTLGEVGETEGLEVITTPANANTPAIEFTTDDTDGDVIEIAPSQVNPNTVLVTAVGEGTKHITATAGSVSKTIEVTVPAVV